MKNYLAIVVVLMFLFPVGVAAHTTTLIPLTDKNGSRVIRVVHFNPHAGAQIMGVRLGVKDSKTLKGLASIYAIHNGKKVDLHKILVPDYFTVRDGKAEAYTLPVGRRHGFARAGDYVIVVAHLPHWKKDFDHYKQKIAKVFINNGGMISDWPNRLLDKAPEIVPLVPPCAVFPGTLFRAEAVNDTGAKIPHAQISVEFLNYKTSLDGIVPGDPILAQSDRGKLIIFTDSSGTFSFIPPIAGVWTFTLVDGDADRTLNGKELSYDSSVSILVKPVQ